MEEQAYTLVRAPGTPTPRPLVSMIDFVADGDEKGERFRESSATLRVKVEELTGYIIRLNLPRVLCSENCDDSCAKGGD